MKTAKTADQVLSADKLAKRDPHPMLDKRVLLRAGSVAPAARNKDTFHTGGDPADFGYVWNVDKLGRALVDFGDSFGPVITQVSNLIAE